MVLTSAIDPKITSSFAYEFEPIIAINEKLNLSLVNIYDILDPELVWQPLITSCTSTLAWFRGEIEWNFKVSF